MKKYIKPNLEIVKIDNTPIMCGSDWHHGGHHGGGCKPPHHHDKDDFPWNKQNNTNDYEEID